MAQPHQFANHPPADEPRDPEAARKRGLAAGAAAERATEGEEDAWSKKIGIMSVKTTNIPAKK